MIENFISVFEGLKKKIRRQYLLLQDELEYLERNSNSGIVNDDEYLIEMDSEFAEVDDPLAPNLSYVEWKPNAFGEFSADDMDDVESVSLLTTSYNSKFTCLC